MRILIVTYSYAPDPQPRAFRWTPIAELWCGLGHEVHVVTAGLANQPARETLCGVDVVRAGAPHLARLRHLLGGTGGPPQVEPPGDPEAVVLAPSASRRMLRWLHDHTWKLLYWPDYACPWYFAAVRAADALLSAQPFDAMFSVSLPFTGHVVGSSLQARHPGVPWVLDVGDPFCFMERTPTNNLWLYRSHNYRYERALFARARAVAVTNEPTAQRYAELFPESRTSIHVIPPIVSIDGDSSLPLPPWQVGDAPARRLVFSGSLYRAIRSPDFLLRAFSQLRLAFPRESFQLHFVGRVAGCEASFEPYRDLIGRSIFLHGLLPKEVAAAAMRGADALVNIANETPFQFPSKLLEYAAMRKPIINVVDQSPDCANAFLAAYPATFTLVRCADAQLPAQGARLADFLRTPPRMDPDDLELRLAPHRPANIAAAYLALLR